MWAERETLVVCVAMLVQFIGFVGVLVARFGQHRGVSRLSSWLAVTCICLVGIISLGTMETCDHGWLAFATTLPLMAVGATIDLRRNQTGTAF